MVEIEKVVAKSAPSALGNYSHATVYRDLIFVSGIASRDPVTNQVPGLKLNSEGKKLSYDIKAETRATLENIRTILREANSDLDRILEINVFLLEMKDFAAYNEVFAEFFPLHHPARTTLGVASLPGNISIEMKAVAVRR